MNLLNGEIIQMPLFNKFNLPYKNIVREVNETHSRIKCLKCEKSIVHKIAEIMFGCSISIKQFNDFINKHEQCNQNSY